VREAAKWLQAAFDGCRPFANLHLAHLTFYAGQEDAEQAKKFGYYCCHTYSKQTDAVTHTKAPLSLLLEAEVLSCILLLMTCISSSYDMRLLLEAKGDNTWDASSW